MASRIMHLCIAKLVEEKINFKDKDSFYLGCLAPDLIWYGSGGYENSHFGQTLDDFKGIDYVKYIAKYSREEKLSDFKLGYFVHLLTDAIWLKNIQQVYIRANQERKSELYQLGYKDMYKYNPILIKIYDLKPIGIKRLDEEIDEVELDAFDKLLEDVKNDFLVDYIDEEFNVYPMKAVLDFISVVVDKSYESILSIRKEKTVENSIKYYVPIDWIIDVITILKNKRINDIA